MADRRGPSVYSIPPHRAFADALVNGILAMHGGDPMALAQGTILLPNNRAVQAISDAFVRRADAGILMPRLVAIGDPELDDRVGIAIEAFDDGDIPPAIDPLRRQLILARLLQEERALERSPIDAGEAMRLAADLGRVLDQLHIERVSPSALKQPALVEGQSEHWQKSLDILSIILDRWPAELARLGAIDLADRRNRLLERVDARWRETPPLGFVIAAGISTGAPAIADLMRTVSRLPSGQVVLAGLDLSMPDDEWEAIAGGAETRPIETHPQFHLAQLLARMDVARGEVQSWRWGSDADARALRSRAISNAMAPPKATGKWATLPAAEKQFSGVSAIECDTSATEAQAIALAIREAIDSPGIVALVTPDRELARRVSAHLKRWDIVADDSAGRPLSACVEGTLILALATAAAEQFAPVSLLGMLKHPLVKGEDPDTRLEWLDGVRKLDLALRGPRPAAWLDGITAYLASGDERAQRVRTPAAAWWPAAADLLRPLEAGLCTGSSGLRSQISALRDVATVLAGDVVWSGDAGRRLADLLTALDIHSDDGPASVDISVLPALLRALMDGIPIRPQRGGHPRVFIWGLLEAKLQSANTMILGGLNEGVWPALPTPDPWLAPAIRRSLGLPGLERRIGLSAHDLAGALGAPKILLTRAKRDSGGPSIASRFWLRLETLARKRNSDEPGLKPPALRYDLLARAIDASDEPPKRASRPAPNVAAEHRPKRVAVTDVDRLLADPFAFYAKSILKLPVLDPLDAEPGPAWKGTLIHAVLDDWAKHDNWAKGKLIERMRHALDDPGIHPVQRNMWLPALEAASETIEAMVEVRREQGRIPIASEESGETTIDGITVHGRVDRIDKSPDGLAIIDYKTGGAPPLKQVKAGYALQLGLLARIAEDGGVKGVDGTANAFEYWSFGRDGDSFGKIVTPAGKTHKRIPPDQFVEEMVGYFSEAAAQWLNGTEPFIAKLSPDYARDDYDQLMRQEEWQGSNDA